MAATYINFKTVYINVMKSNEIYYIFHYCMPDKVYLDSSFTILEIFVPPRLQKKSFLYFVTKKIYFRFALIFGGK